jgi:hypothetical protein
MRLKHTNPAVNVLTLPGLAEPIEPDAGGGFTVPDHLAPSLLELPFWSVHTEPLPIASESGGHSTEPPPVRKNSRSKTPPPTVPAEASVGGAKQA